MRTLPRSGAGLVSTVALFVLSAAPARGDVLWSWAFGTEAGTFVTDNTFADTANPGVFTFIRFSVSTSQVAGNVGADYVDANPVSTMTWDGTQPTQFARANGAVTNGSNFERVDNSYFYVLEVPNSLLSKNPDETTVLEATLTVRPLRDAVTSTAAPVLSRPAMAVTVLLLAVLAFAALRRRGATTSH